MLVQGVVTRFCYLIKVLDTDIFGSVINIGSPGPLVYLTYEFFKVPKMYITQGAAVLAALRLGLVLQLAHQ